jgi:hypothetical protein
MGIIDWVKDYSDIDNLPSQVENVCGDIVLTSEVWSLTVAEGILANPFVIV